MIPRTVRHLVNPFQNGGIEGARQIGNHHADDMRSLGGQAARHPVRTIVEFLYFFQDALPGRLVEVSPVAKYGTHRRDGEAQSLRYIFKANCHGGRRAPV